MVGKTVCPLTILCYRMPAMERGRGRGTIAHAKILPYNQNGTRICDAFGCRKRRKLVDAHRGMFCAKHAAELRALRGELDAVKRTPCRTTKTLRAEVALRQREARFRKTMEPGHMAYLLELEQALERAQ